MSSLLEQAIIDATALKEAALKNAEAAVLEKYAPEIKKAVESLLEQEDEMDPFAMADEAPGAMPAEEGPVDADVDAPLAATEGEGMCPCPDEGDTEVLTVNFDELMSDEDSDSSDTGAIEDQEDLLGDLQEEHEAEVELSDDLLETIINELGSDCDDDDATDDDAIDEDNLTDIVEKMVVDMASRKTGWLGVSEDTATHEVELELARRQSTEFKEENEALKKAAEELQEKLAKYNFTINEMKQKLEETNLTNARLLYANRILNSPSLNERQKNKLVEAISSAGSVKEAKVIYETLKSTVGSTPDRRGPQSLREAVTRSSSIMSVRENRNKNADPAAERMQILAGIKK